MTTSKSTTRRGAASPGVRKTPARNPLVTSPAQAEREKAGLRRGRARLESEPRVADTNIRSSLI